MSGTVQFGKDYKNKRRLSIVPNEKDVEPAEYLIPKGKHIHLQDGDAIEKGDYIVEGNPAPHDILAIKGVEELANYLVNEIQEVYRLQGVQINDKHIEVIVRQMLQKVEIDDVGETDMIHAEQMDKLEFDEINAKFVAEGKKPATAHPILLGITKASLQTRSFISAASFQETTRVLTEAAVNGKADTLEGLKENVIVGRLIPAGTGAMMNRLREVAVKRDQLILDEREKEAAKAAEAGGSSQGGRAGRAARGRVGSSSQRQTKKAASRGGLFISASPLWPTSRMEYVVQWHIVGIWPSFIVAIAAVVILVPTRAFGDSIYGLDRMIVRRTGLVWPAGSPAPLNYGASGTPRSTPCCMRAARCRACRPLGNAIGAD